MRKWLKLFSIQRYTITLQLSMQTWQLTQVLHYWFLSSLFCTFSGFVCFGSNARKGCVKVDFSGNFCWHFFRVGYNIHICSRTISCMCKFASVWGCMCDIEGRSFDKFYFLPGKRKCECAGQCLHIYKISERVSVRVCDSFLSSRCHLEFFLSSNSVVARFIHYLWTFLEGTQLLS